MRSQTADRATAPASSACRWDRGGGPAGKPGFEVLREDLVRWSATSLNSPERLNCARAPDSRNFTDTSTCDDAASRATDVVSNDGARARRAFGVASGAAHHAAKVLIVALHVENAVECADDGAELDVDFAFGAAALHRFGQACARHAARHLVEIGEKPPDLGAREADGKRLPQFDAVALDRSPIDAHRNSRTGPLRAPGLSPLRRPESREKSLALPEDASRPDRSCGRGPCGMSRRVDRFQRALNRLDDADIAGAAAQVAGQLQADSLLVGIRKPRDDVASRHQHAGSAEAALQGMMLGEGFPQHVHHGIVLEAFERRDRPRGRRQQRR